ncbi:MAG: actin-binding WH2 domain-containing protein [Spirulina sp.]
MNYFGIVMEFLRDRLEFLQDVRNGKNLEKYILSFALCSALFFAIYGGIMGSFSSGWQAIASAIKLPALYLLTLLICLPALFFFNVISGSKRTFLQYLCLLLASMSAISVMLFGFAPIVLFFRLSINDYIFFTLLNIVILAASSFIGVQFFYRSMHFINDLRGKQKKRSISAIKGWLVLYGFVGSQLGWTLKPFFGVPGETFAVFRPVEGNFYAAVIQMCGRILGLN